jgi:hypothetical protein
MTKFVGSLVISLVVVVAGIVVIRSLPDIARYLKMREM